MGDVADILGVLSGSKRPAAQKKDGKDKKPEGMSREVYSLLGQTNSLPSLMPFHKPEAKREKVASNWKWSKFLNSARSDELRLGHWQRTAIVDSDYVFSRFNKKCFVAKYTEQEYELIIAPKLIEGMPRWTKAETDTLFQMCEDFDLRWCVIEDRWPLSTCRQIPQLKDRYYSVSKALLQARRNKKAMKNLQKHETVVKTSNEAFPTAGEAIDAAIPGLKTVQQAAVKMPRTATVSAKTATQTENALLDFSYDRSTEERREAQLMALYSRSPEEEKLEASLVKKIREIDSQLKVFQRNTKTAGSDRPTLWEVLPPVAFRPTVIDLKKNEPPGVKSGIELRSSRLIINAADFGIGPRLKTKLEALLLEIGAPIRPVCTTKVCDEYDRLRKDALKLLVLHSKAFKLRSEIALLKGIPPPHRHGQSNRSRKRKEPGGNTMIGSSVQTPTPKTANSRVDRSYQSSSVQQLDVSSQKRSRTQGFTDSVSRC